MIVRELKWSRPGPRGIGLTRRRSCEKDHARAKKEHERFKRDCAREQKWNKGTLHQKRVRQRRKSDRLRKK